MSPSPDGDNSKLEQLMISMLEERDKLMEKLRESQETYNEATRRLNEVQEDNSVLLRQLQALMPEVRGCEGVRRWVERRRGVEKVRAISDEEGGQRRK